jgi:hypothetical protein
MSKVFDKYICGIKEKNKSNAKILNVTVNAYNRAYARRLAEIEYPDYIITKINPIFQTKESLTP